MLAGQRVAGGGGWANNNRRAGSQSSKGTMTKAGLINSDRAPGFRAVCQRAFADDARGARADRDASNPRLATLPMALAISSKTQRV
jgi:hypothetical protein